MALAAVPAPVASRNLQARIGVVQLTPATPRPLLPWAAMVPDTCVPWEVVESSSGSPLLVMALMPWTSST